MKKIRIVFKYLLVFFLLLPFVRLIAFHGPAVEPEAMPQAGILDMHVHTAGIGAGDSGCFISQDMMDSFKLDIYLGSFGVDREELERHGDQIVLQKISQKIAESKYVDAAIILSLDGVIKDGELDREKTEVYVPSDFVARETAKYDNLFFGASINPNRPDAIERLVKAHQQGAKLLKWIPSIMDIDPAGEKLIPFYDKLVELNIPLLTHTGNERSFTFAKDEYGDPIRLELPLERGVRVIAAHAATTGEINGVENIDRLISMLDKYENLYSEISSLTQINKYGYLDKVLKEKKFQGKLIYGSDFPLINTPLVSSFYYPLHLSTAEILEVSALPNVWDRDVSLKNKLGVPNQIFSQTRPFFQ